MGIKKISTVFAHLANTRVILAFALIGGPSCGPTSSASTSLVKKILQVLNS